MKKTFVLRTALLFILCLMMAFPAAMMEGIEEPVEEQTVVLEGETSEAMPAEAAGVVPEEEIADAEAEKEAPENLSDEETAEAAAEEIISEPETAEMADNSEIPTRKLVQNTRMEVNVGEAFQLVHGSLKAAAYQSSDGWALASCKNGLITPIKTGYTEITVLFTNWTRATLKLTIVDKTMPTRVVLKEGKTEKIDISGRLLLNAQLYPSTAQSSLIWTSSAEGIASVDANGLVTPHNVGVVNITVTTARGNMKDTIKVTVTDASMPTQIMLNRSGTVKLDLYSTLRLTAKLKPSSASSSIIWTSNGNGIATVRNGVVYPVRPGTVTITATTARGNRRDSVKVTVLDMRAPTSIRISSASKKNMVVGTTRTMAYTVYGYKGYKIRKNLTWYTSVPQVLKVVDAKKGVFQAVGAGKSKVTVVTDNGKRDSFTLKVVAKPKK